MSHSVAASLSRRKNAGKLKRRARRHLARTLRSWKLGCLDKPKGSTHEHDGEYVPDSINNSKPSTKENHHV
ncbi:MAG TPA: hypothetical protein VGY66_36035 [Gemmataceae bacterium]|jgi:hypothetical protein|nr:hypothetical protein [Gemmataceae bacterium]